MHADMACAENGLPSYIRGETVRTLLRGEKRGILLFWFDDQLMLINICTFITTPNMEADFSFLFNLGFFLKPEQEE